jgi:electron-transferring-flavoprotein dehydrogenase
VQAPSLNVSDAEREELPVDVLVVGAGPAGLACAIHLKRLLDARDMGDKTILVVEKAEEIGNHTLSGCVMDPRGISSLFPDWRERGFPVDSEVKDDWIEFLRPGGKHFTLRGPLVPPQFKNHGNVLVSLNRVVRWMAEQAEALGVDVYPGFPAAELVREGERVRGVVTRDSGIAKDGSRKPTVEPGMRILADVTVLGEGPRGHLTKHLVRDLDLAKGKNPQVYGTGVKEIWEIPEERGRETFGKVIHTGGYPLGLGKGAGGGYGGSFIYGSAPDRLSLGFVIGLDQSDARLDPHALFVRWKQHPRIASLLEGGKVLRYGAKVVPEGGYFSMPRLQGDGFCLIGDSAGFLNAATFKGVHLAIESGIHAAEAIADALQAQDTSASKLAAYTARFEASPAKAELWRWRNYRQAFHGGFLFGLFDQGLQMISGGRGLIARRSIEADHRAMQPVAASRLEKPDYDDKASMDKLTDVYWSGTVHEEDQPAHLLVPDPTICVDRCTAEYGNPCQHFCPAAVYEWPTGASSVVINAANCVHCKTCDIADPYENIEWVVPEGGGGPKYIDM